MSTSDTVGWRFIVSSSFGVLRSDFQGAAGRSRAAGGDGWAGGLAGSLWNQHEERRRHGRQASRRRRMARGAASASSSAKARKPESPTPAAPPPAAPPEAPPGAGPGREASAGRRRRLRPVVPGAAPPLAAPPRRAPHRPATSGHGSGMSGAGARASSVADAAAAARAAEPWRSQPWPSVAAAAVFPRRPRLRARGGFARRPALRRGRSPSSRSARSAIVAIGGAFAAAALPAEARQAPGSAGEGTALFSSPFDCDGASDAELSDGRVFGRRRPAAGAGLSVGGFRRAAGAFRDGFGAGGGRFRPRASAVRGLRRALPTRLRASASVRLATVVPPLRPPGLQRSSRRPALPRRMPGCSRRRAASADWRSRAPAAVSGPGGELRRPGRAPRRTAAREHRDEGRPRHQTAAADDPCREALGGTEHRSSLVLSRSRR